MDAPSSSPALAAARRLARRAACPILPVVDGLSGDPAGHVLLVDRAPSDGLLAELAAALPVAEALVLWVAGWSVGEAAAALGRHDIEHGSITGVDLPEPGVLAIVTHDEARADLHAAAIAAPERPFRALAIMPAFNEADVLGPAIGALVAEGVDVYLLDHRSTDATVEVARLWLGRGLVRIERFPDESGFDERNADAMVWRDILRRVEQVSGEVPADWYLFVNADEFRESPWPGTTLAEGLQQVDDLGFNAVNFELVNFRPTPQDAFVEGDDVRERLRFYEPPGRHDLLQVKAWKAQAQPVDINTHGGHDPLFAGKVVCPVPFVLRHYPIRSAAHGRRKVLAERLARFSEEERAHGWHVQYDHYAPDSDFLHDREELVAWDGDAFRAQLLARATQQLLLLALLRNADLAAPEIDLTALGMWLDRRGHGIVVPEDIQAAQDRLLRPAAVDRPDLDAIADDLGLVLEAQARVRGAMYIAATLGEARSALRDAAA